MPLVPRSVTVPLFFVYSFLYKARITKDFHALLLQPTPNHSKSGQDRKADFLNSQTFLFPFVGKRGHYSSDAALSFPALPIIGNKIHTRRSSGLSSPGPLPTIFDDCPPLYVLWSILKQ